MQGNANVLKVLQAALNAEASCMLQYRLDAMDAGRVGADACEGFCCMADQCESLMKELAKRIWFLDSDPVIAPEAAEAHADLASMLADAQKYELALVQQYADATKACWEAGDMSNFHWFQHLSKWHREGDDKYKGHLAWIQKQLWQLKQLGPVPYLQTQL